MQADGELVDLREVVLGVQREIADGEVGREVAEGDLGHAGHGHVGVHGEAEVDPFAEGRGGNRRPVVALEVAELQFPGIAFPTDVHRIVAAAVHGSEVEVGVVSQLFGVDAAAEGEDAFQGHLGFQLGGAGIGELDAVLTVQIDDLTVADAYAPAFLTVQRTVAEPGAEEVGAIVPAAHREGHQGRQSALRGSVGISHAYPGAVVVLFQTFAAHLHGKLRAVLGAAAGGSDAHVAGQIQHADREVIRRAVIENFHRGGIFRADGGRAGHHGMGLVFLGHDLEDEIVEVEEGVHLVVAVRAEGEAFVGVEAAVAIKHDLSDVLGLVADRQFDAGLGPEVHRVADVHPFVHGPGLANHHFVAVVLHASDAEGAVALVLDLKSHGFVAGRAGQIHGVAGRSAIPVNVHGDFHPGVPGAGVDVVLGSAVDALGDHGVHHRAVREGQTVGDEGVVHVAAVAAVPDAPAVLVLQVAHVHVGFLEVFLVEDTAGADADHNVGLAGIAGVDVHDGAVVVGLHLVPQDLEADLVFLFAGAVFGDQFHPGGIIRERSGPFETAGAGVLDGQSAGLDVEAHHQSVLGQEELGIGRPVEDFHLEVVEIEEGVEFVAGTVRAEGEAFQLLVAAVEFQGVDVSLVVAYLDCHAAVGTEVQGIGDGDPFVHGPGVAVQRRTIGAVHHLIEIEGAVVFSPDLHAEGLHAGRGGQIDILRFRLVVPVDPVRELHDLVLGAAGHGVVPDAVVALGALGVHAVRAVGFEDVGFVGIGAVGAADDPAVLALEVADLHEGFLEVFLVDDVSGAGRHEDVGGAGRAAINADHAAVIVLGHAGTVDVEDDLGFLFAGAAGGVGDGEPAAAHGDGGGIVEAAAAGVDQRHFAAFSRQAGVESVVVDAHDGLVAPGDVFALDVVEVELGVPIVVATNFIGAEGEAGEGLDVNVVELVAGDVRHILADLDFHALHSGEVDGVGDVDPLVHGPGLAAERFGRTEIAILHLVEIEGVLAVSLSDLHTEGLGGVRRGDVDAAGVGRRIPIDFAGNFHHGQGRAAFDGRAVGAAALSDAVVAGGPVSVHDLAVSELGLFDLGLVVAGACGASDHPAFLSLQVAHSHEGFLEVFFVEDRAVHPVNAHHFFSGLAGVDGELRPGVILVAGGGEGQVLGAVVSAARGADGQPVGAFALGDREGDVAFTAGVLESQVTLGFLLKRQAVRVDEQVRAGVARFNFHLDVVIVGDPVFSGAVLRGEADPDGLPIETAAHGDVAGLGFAVAGDLPDGVVIVVPQYGDLVGRIVLVEIGQRRARGVRSQFALRHVHVQISETVGLAVHGVKRHNVGLAGGDHGGGNSHQLPQGIFRRHIELRAEDHVVVRRTAVGLLHFQGFAGNAALVLDDGGTAVVGGKEIPALNVTDQLGTGLVALKILFVDGHGHKRRGKRQKKRQEK